MGMYHYAEINGGGVCFAQLTTEAAIDSPSMIPNPGCVRRIGQRWTGQAWEVVAPKVEELAAAELAKIDADTGMPRTLREVVIAMADKLGADAAFLKAKEAAAAVARAKLKK